MAKDTRRIQQNRARKNARNEARKKARKKQQAQAATGVLAEFGCTRSEIANAPIRGAWRSSSLFEAGIGEVTIARTLADGRVAAGLFLVDSYCLGVKDAFLTVTAPLEFETRYVKASDEHPNTEVDPAYARKLIEHAIGYARDLGLEPHRDYRDAAIVFGAIDPDACGEEFEFGKDGKPFFVNGPNLGRQRTQAIMNHLTKRLGPDGFDYLIG